MLQSLFSFTLKYLQYCFTDQLKELYLLSIPWQLGCPLAHVLVRPSGTWQWCFAIRQKFIVFYFILLDHVCPGEDDCLPVSQKFYCYPTSNLGYNLSYSDFLTLSNSQRFGRDLALTNDLSYSTILTPLSNARCVTLYYDSTFENHFLFCISYLPCLLAEQQGYIVENICVCTGNVESILSAPVGMHPSRIMDIVRSSFLHGFIIGYDCLYLSRNVSHICLILSISVVR